MHGECVKAIVVRWLCGLLWCGIAGGGCESLAMRGKERNRTSEARNKSLRLLARVLTVLLVWWAHVRLVAVEAVP
jgi:hypothetical protein